MRLGTIPCPVCGMTGQLYVQTQRIDLTATGRELVLGLELTCGCGSAAADVTVAPQRKDPKVEPAAVALAAEPEEPEGEGDGDGYDPAEHTIPAVRAYVAAHPDEFDAVYDAEVTGKNRVTLLDWMEAQQ